MTTRRISKVELEGKKPGTYVTIGRRTGETEIKIHIEFPEGDPHPSFGFYYTGSYSTRHVKTHADMLKVIKQVAERIRDLADGDQGDEKANADAELYYQGFLLSATF